MKIRLPCTLSRYIVVFDVIAELFESLDSESYGFADVDGTVKINKEAIFIWILTETSFCYSEFFPKYRY